MRCPHCGSTTGLSVLQTRSGDDTIVRRRRCKACAATFQTAERAGGLGLRVRKVDGTIEPFKEESVRKSVRRAAVKPGLLDASKQFDEAVASMARQAAENGVVESQAIGRIVLDQLRRIDRASHIRFALVHLGRRDRAGRAGWESAKDVSAWMDEQYPELRHHRPRVHLDEVVKRDGRRERFDLTKLEKSIGRAAKGRGPTVDDVRDLASDVAKQVLAELSEQPLVTSGQIAAEILRTLRESDPIAYLRYASTAKQYSGPEDYAAEMLRLPRFTNREDDRGRASTTPSSASGGE